MLPHRGPDHCLSNPPLFRQAWVCSSEPSSLSNRESGSRAGHDLVSGKQDMDAASAPVAVKTAPAGSLLERFIAWDGAPARVCFGLFLLGFLLRFGFAVTHPTIFRPDEVFQSLEPAHGLLSGRYIAAWEFLEGARSWLFPCIVLGPMALARAAGLGAPGQIAAVWALFSAVGASTVVAAFVLGFRHRGLLGATLCGAVCATWPDLVYFGPKTLTEIQGGHLLVLAVCLAALPPLPGDACVQPGWWRCVAVGFLLGLCFCIRFHYAPGILVTALWFGRLQIRRCWIPMVIGAAVPVLATAAIDWMTWGAPFFPVWKNLQAQLFERDARGLGDPMPSTYYFTRAIWEWGAAAPLLLIPFAAGMRRFWPLVLTGAVIVLSHMATSYKEFNYIYPATELFLIVAALGTAEIITRLSAATDGRLRLRSLGWQAVGLWVVVAAAINGGASFSQYRQNGHDAIAAAGLLHGSRDLCGLGIFGVIWQFTAGYAWMDRDAPIYAVANIAQLHQTAAAYNYLVVPASFGSIGLPDFTVAQCGADLCVMHRPGDCVDVPGFKSDLFEGQLKP